MRTRTPPEVDRAAAGQKAIVARRARAAIKNDILERRRTALDVAEEGWAAEDPTAPAAWMRVRELLMSIPGVGPGRAEETMRKLSISEGRRIGGMGIRQRAALRLWLAHRGAGSPVRRDRRTRAQLVVLAGPTAVGKGTVSRYIRAHYPDVSLIVSATTRAPRPGEVEGDHYTFVDDATFDRMVADGDFLEWATVHNASRYGTPRRPVEEALAAGRGVLLEIDIQGARAVKAAMPEALLIFLVPPSWEELVHRLTGRGTESKAEQTQRLETARGELASQDEFDVRIVNFDVGRSAADVVDWLAVPAAAGLDDTGLEDPALEDPAPDDAGPGPTTS